MLVHDLLASTNASNEEERANAKQRVSTPLHSSQFVKRSPAGACERVRGSAETVTVLEAAAVKWSQLGRERNAPRASKIGILVPNQDADVYEGRLRKLCRVELRRSESKSD